VAYDIVNNHPNHKGECIVCGSPTNWNEKTQKYFRLCKNPKCQQEIRKQYEKRMMRVYNKTHLMDDPDYQKKLLEHRRISGKYKWSDGKEFSYCGSYEKKLLEFLDDIMEYDSRDIVTPGPTFEYTYKGKKHKWIMDLIILPYNLCIDVKAGGANPVGQKRDEYNAKQIAKETMITDHGTYSYLRLTDNNFGQLLGILAELKKNIVEGKSDTITRIHEDSAQEDISYIESVGLDLINRLNDMYLPIRREYTGRFDDSNGPIYEICHVYPIKKNAAARSLYMESINEITTLMRTNYPDCGICIAPINESDAMSGHTISISC
jgi:hypothetical protein